MRCSVRRRRENPPISTTEAVRGANDRAPPKLYRDAGGERHDWQSCSIDEDNPAWE
jgi:hypothetical protein